MHTTTTTTTTKVPIYTSSRADSVRAGYAFALSCTDINEGLIFHGKYNIGEFNKT
jgi:hypothetical protein